MDPVKNSKCEDPIAISNDNQNVWFPVTKARRALYYERVFMMCLSSEPIKHWCVSVSQPVSCGALAFSRTLSCINVNGGFKQIAFGSLYPVVGMFVSVRFPSNLFCKRFTCVSYFHVFCMLPHSCLLLKIGIGQADFGLLFSVYFWCSANLILSCLPV